MASNVDKYIHKNFSQLSISLILSAQNAILEIPAVPIFSVTMFINITIICDMKIEPYSDYRHEELYAY